MAAEFVRVKNFSFYPHHLKVIKYSGLWFLNNEIHEMIC